MTRQYIRYRYTERHQSFESLRKKAVALAQQKVTKRSTATRPTEDKPSKAPARPSSRTPIIIIPNSSVSLLSLSNVKRFLEEFK